MTKTITPSNRQKSLQTIRISKSTRTILKLFFNRKITNKIRKNSRITLKIIIIILKITSQIRHRNPRTQFRNNKIQIRLFIILKITTIFTSKKRQKFNPIKFNLRILRMRRNIKFRSIIQSIITNIKINPFNKTLIIIRINIRIRIIINIIRRKSKRIHKTRNKNQNKKNNNKIFRKSKTLNKHKNTTKHQKLSSNKYKYYNLSKQIYLQKIKISEIKTKKQPIHKIQKIKVHK